MLKYTKNKERITVMKPFLGINKAQSGNSSAINGEEFLVIRAEVDDTDKSLDEEKKPAEKYKSPLPLALRVIKFIGGLFAIVFLVLVTRMYMTSAAAILNGILTAQTALAVTVMFFGIWFSLTMVESHLESKRAANEHAEEIEDELSEEGSDTIELPEESKNVDLLAFNYVLEYGEPKAVMADDESASEYFNCPMNIFADEEKIYIASLDEKYAIDRAWLTAIHKTEEKITIPDWNKETPPTKGEYKQYGITIDNLGRMIIPSYYILEFEYNGEKWGIYFPNYELPVFEEITGLRAE